MYESSAGNSRAHPITRRFLDPVSLLEFSERAAVRCLTISLRCKLGIGLIVAEDFADDGDVPLRPLINDLLAGEPLRNLGELRTWVGALRLLRCNERRTEAGPLRVVVVVV